MSLLTPAEKLLKSLGITDPKEIDLEAIALSTGAIVKERPLSGCEAQITGNKDKAIITVNSDARLERKRFSIGHELGHWTHHRGQTFICRSSDIGNQEKTYSSAHPERVADDFAADLLLPAYLFEPLAHKDKMPNLDAIRKLSSTFTTSFTATALRYIKYSPKPSMLVCHAPDGRKWFRHGNKVPTTLFPKDELDAESYAMDVLYQGKAQSQAKLIKAGAWFSKSGINMYELHEESMKIHDGRILTLLSWRDSSMLERYAA